MASRDDDEAQTLDAISKVLRGDPGAFRQIVRRYEAQVFRICVSVLRNREDAEDAAQEAFTRAFRSLGTFRLDRRFRPWIASIALNTSKRHYRKGRRTSDRRAEIPGEDLPSEATQERDCERNEARGEVLQAVERLPRRLRDSVVLYYLEGFQVADIAEALSLSEENIKSRLHRARGVLRKYLESSATVKTDGG